MRSRSILRFMIRLDDKVTRSRLGNKALIIGVLIVMLVVLVVYFVRDPRDVGTMVTVAIALLGIPILLFFNGRRGR